MGQTRIINGDESMMEITAAADVEQGDIVLVGGIAGVCGADILSGARGSVHTRPGLVVEVPKLVGASNGWSDGDLVYRDATTGTLTGVATSNTVVGIGYGAAADGDALGSFVLNLGNDFEARIAALEAA
jgi:predicted RecA/RadA family phage recombinase